MSTLAALARSVIPIPSLQVTGRVCAVHGSVILAELPHICVGDACTVQRADGGTVYSQAISFKGDMVTLAPFDDTRGVSPGAPVVCLGGPPQLRLPNFPLGSVIDPLGKSLTISSGCGTASVNLDIHASPPNPISRKVIDQPLETGIRSIDALTTIGYGQRIGLFAGPGVGKSTLLGALTRNADCDIVVTALVGERGREVNEFLNDSLGAEGLKRSIVVVATSDEPPLRRSLAAMSATAIAEHYRAQGKRVLLLIDSLTRVARAIREVSLAAGEIPVRQGYTARVYSELPQLLERAGNDARGSITAIYTVLTNADESDPLAEEIKSLLDGHIVLDETMIRHGVRPAIDPLKSCSRLFTRLHSADHQQTAEKIRSVLARLRKDKELLLLGGTPDAELQAALQIEPALYAFLSQGISERDSVENTLAAAKKLMDALNHPPL